jgi:hypothetical protein
MHLEWIVRWEWAGVQLGWCGLLVCRVRAACVLVVSVLGRKTCESHMCFPIVCCLSACGVGWVSVRDSGLLANRNRHRTARTSRRDPDELSTRDSEVVTSRLVSLADESVELV